MSINEIKYTTNTARAILGASALFKNPHTVIWEYVTNEIQYREKGTKPEVHVVLENDKIIIKGNGEGMNVDGLKNFFTLHGENQERKKGKPGRGKHGTGKAAAFAIANTFLISTIKNKKLFEILSGNEYYFKKLTIPIKSSLPLGITYTQKEFNLNNDEVYFPTITENPEKGTTADTIGIKQNDIIYKIGDKRVVCSISVSDNLRIAKEEINKKKIGLTILRMKPKYEIGYVKNKYPSGWLSKKQFVTFIGDIIKIKDNAYAEEYQKEYEIIEFPQNEKLEPWSKKFEVIVKEKSPNNSEDKINIKMTSESPDFTIHKLKEIKDYINDKPTIDESINAEKELVTATITELKPAVETEEASNESTPEKRVANEAKVINNQGGGSIDNKDINNILKYEIDSSNDSDWSSEWESDIE